MAIPVILDTDIGTDVETSGRWRFCCAVPS